MRVYNNEANLMKINSLTTAEEKLMTVLWKLNSFYMKNVMEEHPEPKPHQNTVSTYLKILVEKGYLTTEKEGRIFKYSVVIPYEDYRSFVLRNFLKQFCNNSTEELIGLLEDEKMLQPQVVKSKIKPVSTPEKKKKKQRFKIADEILKSAKKKKKKKK